MKRNHFWLIIFTILLLPLVISFGTNDKTAVNQNTKAASCQKVVIPAYFYPNPTTIWDQMTATLPAGSIVIVDPANGPGPAVDANYTAAIAKAKAKGLILMGYVTSSYATHNPADIKAQIDQWNTMYGLTDIFIDEVTSDAGHVAFHTDLYNYVKSKNKNALVMINPGVGVDEGYVNSADIISIFENVYTTYTPLQLPAWVTKYPPSKFLHLVHTTADKASMQNAITLSQQRNAGYVYVTDGVMPNPWTQLPTYWTDELAAIASSCTGGGTSSITQAPSQPAPTSAIITPTFNVIVPCPSCATTEPTSTPVVSSEPVPSSIASFPTSGMTEPSPSVAPCGSSDASIATDNAHPHGKHNKHNGSVNSMMEAFIKLLMQLITLLMQQLGGGQVNIPSQTQSPEPSIGTVAPSSTAPCTH
jgi:hypothetical protein